MKSMFHTRAGRTLAAFIGLILIGVGAFFLATGFDLSVYNEQRAAGYDVTQYVAMNADSEGGAAFRIQYIGTGTSPSIEINAAGDVILKNGSAAADTTVSSDGTVDVSGASENTFGELADAINASANWRCALTGVLPSWSCDNVLAPRAEYVGGCLLKGSGGQIPYMTADLDKHSIAIGPEALDPEILGDTTTSGNLGNRTAEARDFGTRTSAWRSEVYYVSATASYSSGAPDLQIWACNGSGADADEVLLWSVPGAASASAKTIDLTDLPPLRGPLGWRLLAVYNDTSTPDMTDANMQVHGLTWTE